MQEEINIFWAEMSPCEHFVQIYDTDKAFIDALAEYVRDGLELAHSAVVIATEAHRQQLDEQLAAKGINIAEYRSNDCFISLDAEETLRGFTVDGWPDERLFEKVINGILKRAGRDGRRVRAFGEMVALMWARGECGATVRLEYLWTQLCKRESFPLFCAYPKSGFTKDPIQSINQICAEHSKVFASR